MGSTVTTMADWASAYAAVGFRVLPLWPGEKRPIYDGWPRDATTDPALIERYWNRAADDPPNIGVVCGEKFDAWDIEGPHLDAFCRWAETQSADGAYLSEAPIQQTARGGWHILTEPTGVAGSRNLYLDGRHIGELK
jgi:bifunctional DNA primase/polymerase-like protein